jgi:hypothetical protein
MMNEKAQTHMALVRVVEPLVRGFQLIEVSQHVFPDLVGGGGSR